MSKYHHKFNSKKFNSLKMQTKLFNCALSSPPPLPTDDAGAEFVDLMIWKILVVCNFVQNFLCSQTRTQFDKKHNRLLSKKIFISGL